MNVEIYTENEDSYMKFRIEPNDVDSAIKLGILSQKISKNFSVDIDGGLVISSKEEPGVLGRKGVPKGVVDHLKDLSESIKAREKQEKELYEQGGGGIWNPTIIVSNGIPKYPQFRIWTDKNGTNWTVPYGQIDPNPTKIGCNNLHSKKDTCVNICDGISCFQCVAFMDNGVVQEYVDFIKEETKKAEEFDEYKTPSATDIEAIVDGNKMSFQDKRSEEWGR